MSLILGLKFLLVPALIGAVTLAGRRWGPSVAGWLSGFPIVAAPTVFFIAWEQGRDFASTAVLGTLLGIPSVLAFNLAYAWTALRGGWPAALALALAAYAATAGLLFVLAPGPLPTALLCLFMLITGPRLFPSSAGTTTRTPLNTRSELLYRMLAAAALVLLVTRFAETLGPRLAGLFAMFPVISIVLAAFSHRYCGAGFAIRLLRGVVLGWYALLAFFLLLYLLLPRLPLGLSFGLASLAAAVVHLASRRFLVA